MQGRVVTQPVKARSSSDPSSEGKVVWWPSQWRQGRVMTQPVNGGDAQSVHHYFPSITVINGESYVIRFQALKELSLHKLFLFFPLSIQSCR